MPNANKIIYSLRVHLELEKRGFECLSTFENPYKPGLMCWTYSKTPAFCKALDAIMEGGVRK